MSGKLSYEELERKIELLEKQISEYKKTDLLLPESELKNTNEQLKRERDRDLKNKLQLERERQNYYAILNSLPAFFYMHAVLTKTLIAFIDAYQRFVSPLLGPRCRFAPSCSEYSRQAIERYGPLTGVFMSLKRLLKCHPLHPGGYDPVG